MRSEFARFVIVGAVAATANIGSRIIFSIWVGFVPAVAMAYAVGIATAFVLNRNWVFLKSGKRLLNEGAWFVAINVVGLAQTIATAWILAIHVLPRVGQTSFVEETAHTIGVMVPIVTSYFGHKYLTFKRSS